MGWQKLLDRMEGQGGVAAELQRMSEWLKEHAQPRTVIHAHFQVNVPKRQWMTDGSRVIWVPLTWIYAIEWRKAETVNAPVGGLAHGLAVAGRMGTPVIITDPYNARR